MAKVTVTVVHEETAEVDIGEISPQMFRDMLSHQYSTAHDWSISDLGGDWDAIVLEVEGVDTILLSKPESITLNSPSDQRITAKK